MTQPTEPVAEAHRDPLGPPNNRNDDAAGPDLATAIANAAHVIRRGLDGLARELALLTTAVENKDITVDVSGLGE